MPKFEVKVKRLVDHSAIISVTAEDEDSATDSALKRAKDSDPKIEWELESEDFEVEEVDEEDEEEDDSDE